MREAFEFTAEDMRLTDGRRISCLGSNNKGIYDLF